MGRTAFVFFSPWPANLKFDLSNDSCQLLSPLSGIPLAASVCQQNNCHQLRLSGAQVNAQQRPVDYARKVGEGQPELSPIFDVCTKQPAVSPQDWPRRTAAAVRECSNRPRYRTHFCWFWDGFVMKFTALVDFPSYKPPFTSGISQPVTVARRYAKTK